MRVPSPAAGMMTLTFMRAISIYPFKSTDATVVRDFATK